MMNEETIFGWLEWGFAILLFPLAVVIIVSLIKVWQTKITTVKEEVYQKQTAVARSTKGVNEAR